MPARQLCLLAVLLVHTCTAVSQRSAADPGDLRSGHGPIRRLWGVSDVTVPVGRRFIHKIDKDAFQGPVDRFEVWGEKVGQPLPFWLTFNSSSRTFSAVPLEAELGPHLICVRAQGRDGASGAKDVFMIDVVLEEDLQHQLNVLDMLEEGDGLQCADGSAPTVMSLYFDVPPQTLDGIERLQLLQALADRYGLHVERLRVGTQLGALPTDSSTSLEAGHGPAADTRGKQLTHVTWKVGCGGKVHPSVQSSVETVRRDSGLSRLSEAVHRPAVGWILHTLEPTTRDKRQTDGSGTADTGRVYDDYSYDYDYDYGDGDYEYIYPDERIVPTQASSQLGDPPATPVYPPPRVSVPGRMSTPIPTPVVPTRYLPDRLQPSLSENSPGPSGTFTDQLEPSMMTNPSAMEATARLPGDVVATPTLAKPPIQETASVSVPDHPPYLRRRMRKQLLVAGKEFRYRVSEKAFFDLETGGGTRSLQLSLMKATGQELTPTDWLQFNPRTQEIYGLPKEEDTGEHLYTLTARDESGGTASDTVHLVVRSYQQWRAVNHRFHMDVERADPASFPVTVDWQLLLLQKLATLFGQSSTAGILVYDIRDVDGHPVRFTWVNDTLSSYRCDLHTLSRISQRLLDSAGEPTSALRNVLSPEFQVLRVDVELLNACRGQNLSRVPSTTTEPPAANNPPLQRRRIGRLEATVGHLLDFQIPDDTFFDPEDGGTGSMSLRLLTGDREPLPDRLWVRFEPQTRRLTGLPGEKDVGRAYFRLECVDSGGLKTTDSFELVVRSQDASTNHSALFNMTLDNDFGAFSRDPALQILLVQRIARLFGDPDASAVLLDAVVEGSVVVTWYNQSLPRDRCPAGEVDVLKDALVGADGGVSERAVQALAPEFRLTSAEVTLQGVCLEPTPPPSEPPETEAGTNLTAAAPPGEKEKAAGSSDQGGGYLLTYVVPGVVIAAMLLIAGLVACVLVRVRRRGKMTMTENGTYVSRGVPVIFADELDEPPNKPRQNGDHHDPAAAAPMLNERGEPNGAPPERERPPPPPFSAQPAAQEIPLSTRPP